MKSTHVHIHHTAKESFCPQFAGLLTDEQGSIFWQYQKTRTDGQKDRPDQQTRYPIKQ